jgi:hypothetical protein
MKSWKKYMLAEVYLDIPLFWFVAFDARADGGHFCIFEFARCPVSLIDGVLALHLHSALFWRAKNCRTTESTGSPVTWMACFEDA